MNMNHSAGALDKNFPKQKMPSVKQYNPAKNFLAILIAALCLPGAAHAFNACGSPAAGSYATTADCTQGPTANINLIYPTTITLPAGGAAADGVRAQATNAAASASVTMNGTTVINNKTTGPSIGVYVLLNNASATGNGTITMTGTNSVTSTNGTGTLVNVFGSGNATTDISGDFDLTNNTVNSINDDGVETTVHGAGLAKLNMTTSTGTITVRGGNGLLIDSLVGGRVEADVGPGVHVVMNNTGNTASTSNATSNNGIKAYTGNAGTIRVNTAATIETSGSFAHGIYALNTNVGAGSGTINVTNTGPITTADTSSNGILVQTGTGAVTIQNSGAIDAQKSTGIWSTSTGATSLQITNNTGGSISGGLSGINVRNNFTSSTINNSGTVGSTSDIAINASTLTTGPLTVNNQAGGVINGYLTGNTTASSKLNTVNNGGAWNLRNFADTNTDLIPDTQSVAVSNLGTNVGNIITNTGTLSLPAVAGAASLVTTGQYLPMGFTFNSMTLGGPTQGQVLGSRTFSNNGGTLDMQANNVPGDVLVISGGQTAGTNGGGTYITGGYLNLDTVANAGGANSQSDVLVVDNTLLGGAPTQLNIHVTGAGALTTGDGILVVQALGTTNAGDFALASPIVVNGFTYSLFKGGVGASNPNNWYLRSTTAPVVSLTKIANVSTLTPGGTVVYTITATNTGVVAASNVVITDSLPTGVTSFNWTCSGTCPAASGSGAINQTIPTLAVSGFAIYTITATISATPPASVTNTAQAAVSGGLCAPGNTPSPCIANAALPSVPVVSISKTTASASLTPGGTVSYTVVATNTSAASAAGTVIADPIPTGITGVTWTCTATGGAVCPAASGSTAINATVATFPGNSALTYTITGTVSATPPASVVNTASATLPTGGLCAPGNTPSPCTSSASVPPLPVVQIQKTTPSTTLTPSGTVTYTIVATNTSAVSAAGTVIADPIPTGITGFTWTCTATGGAVCPAVSGTTAINATVATFPGNSALTYTITATVSATPPASVVNTVTASVPGGGLCAPGNTPSPCTSSASVPPVPVVQIEKTTPSTTLTPNGTVTYTIVASNTSAVSAAGTVITDPIPAGITSYTWTCAASSGAVCPAASGSAAINATVATFPGNSALTYTITATVSATPPASVVNTVSAALPTGGLCAPANTPSPCTSSASVPPVPVVRINKTTTTTAISPGGSVAYSIAVTNSGSVSATGTVITDPVPAGLTGYTWTCAATGGAVCPAVSGSAALNETVATFPAGSSLTYTITGTVVAATPPASIINTATATLPTGGLCAPANTPSPCSSSVTVASVPVVQVTKSTVSTSLTPGGTVAYTVLVANTSAVSAAGTVVADPIPAGITSYTWTCTATGGAVCPAASGSTAINATIATFPGNASLTYAITATVSATPPASVTNVASATLPSGGLCAPGNTPSPCTGSASVPPVPVVQVEKSTVATSLTPSGTITYTVVATNASAVSAAGTVIADPIPTGITGVTWTCTSTGGAVCPALSGTAALNETIATFPGSSSLTYLITATVSATPPASVVNTATASTAGGGLCAPGNTPSPCTSSASVPPVPVVQVTKTTTAASLTPGGTVTYTVIAANISAVSAASTVIADPIPAGIASVTWTCAAAGGAVCPAASGTAALNETIATFPGNASLTYTITATVSAAPPSSVTNTVLATLPAGGFCAPGNTLSPCTASVSTPVAVTPPPAASVAIPTLHTSMLTLLALLLGMTSFGVYRRQPSIRR